MARRPGPHSVRLTLGSEESEWRVAAFSEVVAICTHANTIAEIARAHSGPGDGPPPPPAPSALLSRWLLSGTVEKEGKVRSPRARLELTSSSAHLALAATSVAYPPLQMRWASRWLVLSAGRLFVLRDAWGQAPLNVIPLNDEVRTLPRGSLPLAPRLSAAPAQSPAQSPVRPPAGAGGASGRRRLLPHHLRARVPLPHLR